MIKVDRYNRDSKAPEDKDKGIFVTIFTDGSHCPNTMAWGVGIWFRYSDNAPVEMSFGGVGLKNSYEVEMRGLELAINHVMGNFDLSGMVVVIQCDNVGALNSSVNKFRPELMRMGAKFVKAKHVKGHTSHKTSRSKVNAIVDRLAGERMRENRL